MHVRTESHKSLNSLVFAVSSSNMKRSESVIVLGTEVWVHLQKINEILDDLILASTRGNVDQRTSSDRQGMVIGLILDEEFDDVLVALSSGIVEGCVGTGWLAVIGVSTLFKEETDSFIVAPCGGDLQSSLALSVFQLKKGLERLQRCGRSLTCRGQALDVLQRFLDLGGLLVRIRGPVEEVLDDVGLASEGGKVERVVVEASLLEDDSSTTLQHVTDEEHGAVFDTPVEEGGEDLTRVLVGGGFVETDGAPSMFKE